MTFYLLCLGLKKEKKKDCKSQNQKGSIINMGLKMCFFKQLNHDNTSAAMTTFFFFYSLVCIVLEYVLL